MPEELISPAGGTTQLRTASVVTTAGIGVSVAAALAGGLPPQNYTLNLTSTPAIGSLNQSSGWAEIGSDEMADAQLTKKIDELIGEIRTSKTAQSGRFGWKDWAPAVGLAVVFGLGALDFSGRLAALETRLTGLQSQIHDDLAKLTEKVAGLDKREAVDTKSTTKP